MIRAVLFAGAVLLATQAHAIGAVTGHVIQVRVDGSGAGMVIFDQNIGNAPPACGQDSSYKNALAFSGNAAGKNILAMALFAKATNAVVVAYGVGTCAIYGDYVEDWSYGQVL